ncbi:Meiotic expression up-regulated protein 10 [Smittium culicis]|uniref:Meiotic expression up-regulated protein 10 n=2 Tax=Smittium culicis TaxID=133412 RepID=A0A1R1XYF6_9FUNG|nr:Meiotic expression up-regulated protein 10 [Smittium culicis]
MEQLDFRGLKSVKGDLIIDGNNNLFQVKMDDLLTVNGSILVENNAALIEVSINSLQQTSKLSFYNVPQLVALRLDSIKKVSDLRIVQTSIHGLGKVSIDSLNSLEIGSNPNLSLIDFTNLTSIKGSLSIANNHLQTAANFPNLKSIKGTVTLRNLFDVNIDSLAVIEDTFNLIDNSFKNFTLNLVSTAEKDITIIGNDNLNSFSFSSLTSLNGGLQIKNNTALQEIGVNSFKKLTTIKGGMELYGPFDNITFPAITNTLGAITIESTGNLDCVKTKSRLGSAIKSLYKCSEKQAVSSNPTKKEFSSSVTSGTNSILRLNNLIALLIPISVILSLV